MVVAFANTVYKEILFLNQKGKIALPFQYLTYFDEHKLTGVMVTSQFKMFTYRMHLVL